MKYVRVLKGYQDYHHFETGSICVVVEEKYEEGPAYNLKLYSHDYKSRDYDYRQSIFQKDVEVLEDQPKIISFMRLKAACTDERYFTTEDEELIWNWSNEKASMVWRKLIAYFKENNEDDWLDGSYFTSHLCPFCIYEKLHKPSPECEKCPYGKNHKVCSKDDSDYQMIIKPIYNADSKNIDRKIKKFLYNFLESGK